MKNNWQPFRYIFASAWASIILSCSNTKYLKEGQMLYTGATINIKNDTISKKEKKALQSDLEANLTPKPNSTFLGLRPKLFFYNIAPVVHLSNGYF
ncbi:hypothetical protein [Chryseobacterium fistulae]|uniref:Uncharacterized protein n=1 Tax=Chryseobacterium fistulae TaxID=2675058 RepID=A0A6N4XSR2_9FLAO|nr:hypothetical protein [Chryseobacterium fistulae]CAA7392494.1 hypothetical protein CHRY9393_03214 [Chryseobacterium fistulae]